MSAKNGSLIFPSADGLIYKNTVFVSGLVIAPLVCAVNSVVTALALSFVFTSITFSSILISSFFSRKVVYTFRIILYTIVAALVYVPTVLIANSAFPVQVGELSIYAPLLITNSLIVSKAELKFYKFGKLDMVKSVALYVLGFDLAALFFGASREFLLDGFGKAFESFPTFPAFAYPFGGFILLGILSALFRGFVSALYGKGDK